MRWYLLLFALVLMPVAYSLKLYDIDCFNDGHVELTLEGENESRVYTSDIKISDNSRMISGSWGSFFIKKSDKSQDKYGVFKSREGIFNAAKTYELGINYILTENTTASYESSMQVSVSCPGLIFSCSLLNISIKECYTKDNKFNAVITANGLKQSDAADMDFDAVTSYILHTKESYVDRLGVSSKKGELPAGHSVAYLKNDEYLLSFDLPDNFVESLYVQFNNELFKPCSTAEYTFKRTDIKTCSDAPIEPIPETVEITPKTTEEEKPVEEEPHIEQPAEIIPEKQPDDVKKEIIVEDEGIDPKTILMLAFIILIIGGIVVYLLKQRDIM